MVLSTLGLALILRGRTKSLKKLEEKFEEAVQETLNQILEEAKKAKAKRDAENQKQSEALLDLKIALQETVDKNRALTSEKEVSANFELKDFMAKESVVRSMQLRYLFLEVEQKIQAQKQALENEEHFDLAELDSFYQPFLKELDVINQQLEEIEKLNETIGQLNATIDAGAMKMEKTDTFKDAYNDMENVWENIHASEQNLYEKLHQFLIDQNAPEDLIALFNQLHHGCNDVSALFNNNTESRLNFEEESEPEVIFQQSDSLFNVAKEQGALIAELKEQLANAENDDNLIQTLQDQLDKIERKFQESESCIQLLENELEDHQARIQAMTDSNQKLKDKIIVADANEMSLKEKLDKKKEELSIKKQELEEALKNAPTPGVDPQIHIIQKELYTMEKRYLDLFEKTYH